MMYMARRCFLKKNNNKEKKKKYKKKNKNKKKKQKQKTKKTKKKTKQPNHYENTPIQLYWKNYHQKRKFSRRF